MRIFLLGMMGCGKTTLGKALAKHLKIDFLDLDHHIEKEQGKTIAEIFKDEGEDHFRGLEKRAILDVSTLKNKVIATGGGAPCFFDNIHFMNASGITLFLDVSVQELSKRLYHRSQKQVRPLLKDKSIEEISDFVQDLYAKRRLCYEEAKLIVQGDQLKLDDLLTALDEMHD